MKLPGLLFLLLIHGILSAQTPTSQRLQSYEQSRSAYSPFQGVEFRNIGPTVMSGRVTDIEVNPNNTNEMYVAYASGGVWYSNNNGQSFAPIFDQEATLTVGDIAVDWKQHTIWVGTGEVNSSRSSYAGTGLYKSSDSGKHWQHMGLDESHHIGKVVLHPKNPNIAWVAVLGHLYTNNAERGIYRTNDGGKTWQQTLFVNDSTGCPDLIIDPVNPDILYASSWTRTRKAWQFTGAGEGSGIYKSTDGGMTWQLRSSPNSGFPTGRGVGRIGLSLCTSQPQIVYAVLDNNFNQPKDTTQQKNKIKPRDIANMNTSQFLAIDDETLNNYLRSNEYPEQYTAKEVKNAVRNKVYSVQDVANWRLANADASLFDTPVYGAELYKSTDGGMSWKKTHEELLEGVYFTYGYYFATITVSPTNPDNVYLGGYPLIGSTDGGKTFRDIAGPNCHADYHRIWVNKQNENHLIVANDGGINITYDGGKIWYKANNPAVGQFYAIEVDQAKPYNVYGGLQDNGTWYGPSSHEENTGWLQSGEYAYKAIGDGDGMQVQVDSRSDEVYVGYQFGNYYRMDKKKFNYTNVKPEYLIGEKPLRFNWQTPILLSKHHEDMFYIGSNCIHRSIKKGEQPERLSADLTYTKNKGNVPFGTITTITESPKRMGLLYAGTDDGHIHSSKDMGYTWNKISNPLPQNLWVTRVIASAHKLERVYATLNGYRQDDFQPYVFVSNDYGKNWTALHNTLPQEPVNVIREDPTNENIIYVGTDNGIYVSTDGGKNFMAWRSNLPRVAVHDIAIQARENEIVLGTHGRSLYIASLQPIQQYATMKEKKLTINKIDTVKFNESWGSRPMAYSDPILPEMKITYFLPQAETVDVSILTDKGSEMYTSVLEAKAGFNTWSYDLSCSKSTKLKQAKVMEGKNGIKYLKPGNYRVRIQQGNHNAEQGFTIK